MQQQWQQEYEWMTGTGDGSNQPIIYGHRLPTAAEMKLRPIFGAPVMMTPDDTYADAVKNWATYVCRSSNPGPGFCEWSETVGNSPANGWDAVFTVLGAAGLAFGARGAGSGLRVAAGSSRAQSVGNGIRAAARSCHSFLGDTQVLMADGSTKRIDELKVGDHVFATDPESGESGAREVLATLTDKGVKLLVEIEADGSKIVATAHHPFWLPDQQRWADAEELRVGSELQTSAGARVKVTAIKKRIAIKRVHNLTVDDLHTYYVLAGNTPVLVHNANCGSITSAIGEDSFLTKAAQKAGRNETVQREMDGLFKQLSDGNMNPGLGTKSLGGTDVLYARGRNGARLFFRNVDGGIQIVGKADKGNESAVINRLTDLYGR